MTTKEKMELAFKNTISESEAILLSKEKTKIILIILGSNPAIPLETMYKLSKSKYHQVRNSVLRNENLPKDIFDDIYNNNRYSDDLSTEVALSQSQYMTDSKFIKMILDNPSLLSQFTIISMFDTLDLNNLEAKDKYLYIKIINKNNLDNEITKGIL